MANCILCGAELVEGVCPNRETHFKKMCFNCSHNVSNVCEHDKVKESYRNKAIEAVKAAGYDVVDIELSPVPLKNPERVCKLWELNEGAVLDAFLNYTK